jgi:hypothetical protein
VDTVEVRYEIPLTRHLKKTLLQVAGVGDNIAPKYSMYNVININ